MARAAQARGHTAALFSSAAEIEIRAVQSEAGCFGFTRLHQYLPRLTAERELALHLGRRIPLVQDAVQIQVYEDKIAQAGLWGKWMPHTTVAFSRGQAEFDADLRDYPFISKSQQGSASHNVRLIQTRDAAQREIDAVFGGEGLFVKAGPLAPRQKGYVLWQDFIPHEVTWRVAVAGRFLHVYKRRNYADRPMAAPSKVVPTQPIASVDAEIESLCEFSRAFFAHAGTKWCAIDVLKTLDGQWRLLETSLAWARGADAAGLSPFIGAPAFNLMNQHELLIHELEAGVFGEC